MAVRRAPQGRLSQLDPRRIAVRGRPPVAADMTRVRESASGKLPAPFHGVHVAPEQEAHEKIPWRKPAPRCSRVRVRRHTCECRATLYELCMAGGLVLIRRTIWKVGGPIVAETDWLQSRRAEELWQRLLVGESR
jgi:hypothetical protein